jgi:hypothetical protein
MDETVLFWLIGMAAVAVGLGLAFLTHLAGEAYAQRVKARNDGSLRPVIVSSEVRVDEYRKRGQL